METKKVYAYAEDGLYIGERILDKTDRSPMSGAWQIPGNMTETKPPGTVKEGYDLYYHEGAWTQVARSKPAPEPEPQEDTETREPYIDEERLAGYEVLVAHEARIAALEAKGGDKE